MINFWRILQLKASSKFQKNIIYSIWLYLLFQWVISNGHHENSGKQ